MKAPRGTRVILAAGAAIPLMLLIPATAAARPSARIAIPAQSVSGALQELSRQTGVNILFAPHTVAPFRAPAIHAARSVEEAARAILAATPLEAASDPGGGLIVRRRLGPSPVTRVLATPAPAIRPRPAAPLRQRPSPPPPVAAPKTEIVVHADRYDDRALQLSPIAITRIVPEELALAGVVNLATLPGATPSIQVAPVRTTALTFIRGVGTTISSPNADPTIAVNVNGAYIPMDMTNALLFDLERVDVLPGPQSTYFGRDSTGGVIDIVTRRPGERLAANGFAEFGNYGRVQVQLGLDTPLADTLMARTVASWVRHSGYDSNGGDDQDSQAARETLVWKPDSRTSATAIATYSREGGVGPFNFNVPAVYGAYRTLGFDPRAMGFFIDYRTFTASIEVDRQLGAWGQLTYLGAYGHLNQRTKTAAWSSTPLAILNAAQMNDTGSQELRLTTTLGRLQGRAGLYWFASDAHYTSATDNEAFPVSTSNSIGPFRAGNNGWAVFGQQSYALTPRLHLTGGLRFSHTDKSITGVDSTSIADSALGVTTTTYPFAGNTTQDHLAWKLGADLDLFDHALLYTSIATGATPGGFSASPTAPGEPDAKTFLPAYLKAYTAGIKNRLADNRLTLDLEGFLYDYRNYQVSQRNLATFENTVFTADRAQVYGLQVDGHFAPTPRDYLRFDLTFQRARALRLVTPLGVFDGDQLPFAPDATLHVAYRHTFDVAHGARLEASASGDRTSSRWGTYSHWAGTFVSPTFSLDAGLTYHTPDSRYALTLWGRNLTNAIIPTQVTAAPSPAGPGQEFLGPPRTYGMRFGFDF